jgi:hypothetical protein
MISLFVEYVRGAKSKKIHPDARIPALRCVIWIV